LIGICAAGDPVDRRHRRQRSLRSLNELQVGRANPFALLSFPLRHEISTLLISTGVSLGRHNPKPGPGEVAAPFSAGRVGQIDVEAGASRRTGNRYDSVWQEHAEFILCAAILATIRHALTVPLDTGGTAIAAVGRAGSSLTLEHKSAGCKQNGHQRALEIVEGHAFSAYCKKAVRCANLPPIILVYPADKNNRIASVCDWL